MVKDVDGKQIPWWKWGLFALVCAVFPPILGISLVLLLIAGAIAVVVFLFSLFE
jgi:hypothetical protein